MATSKVTSHATGAESVTVKVAFPAASLMLTSLMLKDGSDWILSTILSLLVQFPVPVAIKVSVTEPANLSAAEGV